MVTLHQAEALAVPWDAVGLAGTVVSPPFDALDDACFTLFKNVGPADE